MWSALYVGCCGFKPVEVTAIESVVSIYDGEHHFIGSGTQIATQSNDTGWAIATAYHVIAGQPIVKACGYIDGVLDCVYGNVYTGPSGRDVSYIEVDHPVAKPAKVRYTETLPLATEVLAVGFPTANFAMFHAEIATTMNSGYAIVGAWCDYGISGGGVYDSRGRLVAVVQSMIIYPTQVDGIIGEIPVHNTCIIHTLGTTTR